MAPSGVVEGRDELGASLGLQRGQCDGASLVDVVDGHRHRHSRGERPGAERPVGGVHRHQVVVVRAAVRGVLIVGRGDYEPQRPAVVDLEVVAVGAGQRPQDVVVVGIGRRVVGHRARAGLVVGHGGRPADNGRLVDIGDGYGHADGVVDRAVSDAIGVLAVAHRQREVVGVLALVIQRGLGDELARRHIEVERGAIGPRDRVGQRVEVIVAGRDRGPDVQAGRGVLRDAASTGLASTERGRAVRSLVPDCVRGGGNDAEHRVVGGAHARGVGVATHADEQAEADVGVAVGYQREHVGVRRRARFHQWGDPLD